MSSSGNVLHDGELWLAALAFVVFDNLSADSLWRLQFLNLRHKLIRGLVWIAVPTC
jgi:hypothetical protein